MSEMPVQPGSVGHPHPGSAGHPHPGPAGHPHPGHEALGALLRSIVERLSAAAPGALPRDLPDPEQIAAAVQERVEAALEPRLEERLAEAVARTVAQAEDRLRKRLDDLAPVAVEASSRGEGGPGPLLPRAGELRELVLEAVQQELARARSIPAAAPPAPQESAVAVTADGESADVRRIYDLFYPQAEGRGQAPAVEPHRPLGPVAGLFAAREE